MVVLSFSDYNSVFSETHPWFCLRVTHSSLLCYIRITFTMLVHCLWRISQLSVVGCDLPSIFLPLKSDSLLESLTFEPQSGLATLMANCFDSCTKHRSVCIPKSIRVIGKHCFENCSAMAPQMSQIFIHRLV
jgi:hypothetical protein